MTIIKEATNKIVLKRVATISALSILSIGLFYVLFSPVIIAASQPFWSNKLISYFSPFPTVWAATTASTSTIVSLSVGKEITISASPSSLSLTGTINGISGGTATGTVAFSVLNSSATGFNMTVDASTSPAMELGTGTASYNSFADYPQQSAATPDYAYATPSAGSSTFGFAILADSNNNAKQEFRNNGSTACNSAAGTTADTNCFFGFTHGSPVTVVDTSVGTGFSSTAQTETVLFEAQHASSTSFALESGSYQATITTTVNAE